MGNLYYEQLQLEYERTVLAIARGSDYSGVKALTQAIAILKEV